MVMVRNRQSGNLPRGDIRLESIEHNGKSIHRIAEHKDAHITTRHVGRRIEKNGDIGILESHYWLRSVDD